MTAARRAIEIDLVSPMSAIGHAPDGAGALRSGGMDLLRHLRYFVAVAEELHFGRAADRLHMAQSPLSQRIRSLERELGVQLFVRSSRQVALTPAGRVLLDEAPRLLAAADDVRALMQRVSDGGLGELRTGMPPDFDARLVAGVLAGFRAACPEVRLDIRQALAAEQEVALATGAIDVGLVWHPLAPRGLATGPVLEKPLGVLLPAHSELAEHEQVELGELRDRALVMFPREAGPATYDEVLGTCRAYGFVPADVLHARQQEFGVGLVMAGDAIAFSFDGERPAQDVVWRPLWGSPLRMRVSTAWRERAAGRTVDAFTHAVVATLCDEGGWVESRPAARRRQPTALRPSSGVLS